MAGQESQPLTFNRILQGSLRGTRVIKRTVRHWLYLPVRTHSLGPIFYSIKPAF